MKEQEILKKHSEIFEYLINFKKQNDSFTFSTRVNNRAGKLEKGYYFQGNDNYIFVPLYKVGSDENMTKTIGFVYTENSQYIEIVYKKIKNWLYPKGKCYSVPTKTDTEVYRKMGFNTVYIPHFRSQLRYEKAALENKIALSVGRMTEAKRQWILIDLWDRIVNHHNIKDWKLHIVGDGNLKETYIKKIKDLNLESYIKILPPKKEVEDYYKEAKNILSSDDLGQDIDVIRLLKKCNDHKLFIWRYPASNGTDTLEVLCYNDFTSFIESGIISDLPLDKIVVDEKIDADGPFDIISDFTIKIHCNISYSDRKWYSNKRDIDEEKDTK